MRDYGWGSEDIRQSKFPVLEHKHVLGCFDGDTLVSQFAVVPMDMNVHSRIFPIGFITSVATYPEYSGLGLMSRLMKESLTEMRSKGQTLAILYPYSTPLPQRLGFSIRLRLLIPQRKVGLSAGCLRTARQAHNAKRPTAACSAIWPGMSTGAGMWMTPRWPSTIRR